MGNQRLLQEDAGVLQIPPPSGTPSFECPFNFFSCTEVFSNSEDWYRHSLVHFRNAALPNKIGCCHCDAKFVGPDSWRQRMEHMALIHHRLGHRSSHARPDFELHHHLWNKRVISHDDFRALTGQQPATGYPSQSGTSYQPGSANMANMSAAYTTPNRSTGRSRR